jgi:hypothetical protein
MTVFDLNGSRATFDSETSLVTLTWTNAPPPGHEDPANWQSTHTVTVTLGATATVDPLPGTGATGHTLPTVEDLPPDPPSDPPAPAL